MRAASNPAALALPRQWPVYDREAIRACADSIDDGRTFDYHHGEELAELERLFADRCARKYALSFNSGTSALFAAYFASGLRAGDEVLVPTYTFLATASPLLLLDAVPVLCDAGDATGNVTVETLAARLSENTRAVVVTHLWGHPCDMSRIGQWATDNDLVLIEDCSHAHGATWDGRPVGSFGHSAIFSVGAHKPVSGGLGGILVTDDPEVQSLATLLGHPNQRSRETIARPDLRPLYDFGLGANLRMSPQAAILAASHMRRLDDIVAVKTDNCERLLRGLEALPGIARVPQHRLATLGGRYGCHVSVDAERLGCSRDALVAALDRRGLPARAPATAPLHLTSAYSAHRPRAATAALGSLGRLDTHLAGDLPNSAGLYDSWLALPATRLHEPAHEFVHAYVAAAANAVADVAT